MSDVVINEMEMLNSEDLKYPIINFTYLRSDQIGVLNSILNSSIEEIKILSENYALYGYAKNGNLSFYDCAIYQIPVDDITSQPSWMRAIYETFINKYGKEKVNLLVAPSEKIRKNIKDVIKFAMDKIHNTGTIRIEFCRASNTTDQISSIPNLIYEIMDHDFMIQKSYTFGNKKFTIISRR